MIENAAVMSGLDPLITRLAASRLVNESYYNLTKLPFKVIIGMNAMLDMAEEKIKKNGKKGGK